MSKRFNTLVVALLFCTPAALAQTAGMLSFQGLVKDSGGDPITGSITLEFRIYDAKTMIGNLVDMDGDGTAEDVIGQDAKQVGVTAVNGLVSTKFGPVSPKAFNGDPRWLEVSVNGVALDRVEMATAPATAEQVNRPGTSTVAVTVDSAGKVGVGTTTPQSQMHLSDADTGSNGATFLIETTGAPGLTGAGVAFNRSGVGKKFISMNGQDDLAFHQGNGSNSSVANRIFMQMSNSTGNTFLGGHVGIGVQPLSDAILKVGAQANNVSLLVESQAALVAHPLVEFAWSGNNDPTVTMFNIKTDIDEDAGGPFDAFSVTSDGLVHNPFGDYHGPSDERLKRDVVTVPDALKRVLELRGVNFKWKNPHVDGDSLQMGLIAQEVEKVFPEVVHTAEDKMETKAVEYEHLVGALVEAIKELNGHVRALETTSNTAARLVEQKDARIAMQGRQIDELSARLERMEALMTQFSADSPALPSGPHGAAKTAGEEGR